MEFKAEIKNLPNQPGVYLFKNSENGIIYVGKAKNLKNRIKSYFLNQKNHNAKTKILVKNIKDLDYIIVDNEVEALLLENQLIKKHSPKYNILLKDSKTYAYIKISDEKFPKILSTRKTGRDGNYFGPYTDGFQRRELVKLITKIFKLRTCKTMPKKACLNYHIGICSAPCEMKIGIEEYKKSVSQARELLKGNTKEIIETLKLEMLNASENQKYELALQKREEINLIQNLQEKQKVELVKNFDQHIIASQEDKKKEKINIILIEISKGVIRGKKEFQFEDEEELLKSFIKLYYSKNQIPREIIIGKEIWENENEKEDLEKYLSKYRGGQVTLTNPKKGEKKELLLMAMKNIKEGKKEDKTLAEIKEKLNLPELPNIIECFDISNLGREHIVGAMTRWVNAKPEKNSYRKFEIKSFKGKNDDYRAMQETVYRRYKRLKDENNEMPDLIIIDGGKGQLSAALKALQTLKLKIPIISLAKKEEEIFIPGQEEAIKIPKNSEMMLLIRNIRNSVHNFVLGYNRKKRDMKLREEFEKIKS